MDLEDVSAYEALPSQLNNCVSSRSNECNSHLYRIKTFFKKKVQNIKDNSVYIETLSLKSIKRSMQRTFKIKRSPKSAGYVKFLTDEERQSVFVFI